MTADMFDHPDRVRVIRNPEAYAGNPGQGPAGKRCRDCRHLVVRRPNLRTYFKCGLVRWTHGAGTDIRKHMPACQRFEEES